MDFAGGHDLKYGTLIYSVDVGDWCTWGMVGLSRYCVHFEGLIGGVGGPGVETFGFSGRDGASKYKRSALAYIALTSENCQALVRSNKIFILAQSRNCNKTS